MHSPIRALAQPARNTPEVKGHQDSGARVPFKRASANPIRARQKARTRRTDPALAYHLSFLPFLPFKEERVAEAGSSGRSANRLAIAPKVQRGASRDARRVAGLPGRCNRRSSTPRAAELTARRRRRRRRRPRRCPRLVIGTRNRPPRVSFTVRETAPLPLPARAPRGSATVADRSVSVGADLCTHRHTDGHLPLRSGTMKDFPVLCHGSAAKAPRFSQVRQRCTAVKIQ